MPARSWIGLSARWYSQGQQVPSITPVIVLGHDASDQGGMRGVEATVSTGGADVSALRLTSSLGFAVWYFAMRSGAAPPLLLRVAVEATPTPLNAPAAATVNYMTTSARDVVATGGGLAVPYGALIQPPLALARPILVPPGGAMTIFDGLGGGSVNPTVMFEEGL